MTFFVGQIAGRFRNLWDLIARPFGQLDDEIAGRFRNLWDLIARPFGQLDDEIARPFGQLDDEIAGRLFGHFKHSLRSCGASREVPGLGGPR